MILWTQRPCQTSYIYYPNSEIGEDKWEMLIRIFHFFLNWKIIDGYCSWNTYGSPNPGQKTRPSVNLQEENNLWILPFKRTTENKGKKKGKKKGKYWQILGSYQRGGKAVEHAWNVTQGFEKKDWQNWSLEVLFTNPSARAGYDTRSIF